MTQHEYGIPRPFPKYFPSTSQSLAVRERSHQIKPSTCHETPLRTLILQQNQVPMQQFYAV